LVFKTDQIVTLHRNFPTVTGNAAWAHILAVHKLNMEWESKAPIDEDTKIDGKAIFVTDDTEPKSWYDFLRPFLRAKNYYTLQLPVPLSLLYAMVWTFNKGASFFPDNWKKWLDSKGVFPTVENFHITHSIVRVSRERATQCLDYSPVYPVEEATKRSIAYYKSLAL